MEKTVVIGIGNILQKDDGFGVHVINELIKMDLPEYIELVDGGTCTLSMTGYFSDFPKVIIIDALKGGMEPGTIYKIKAQEIENYKRENLSAHDIQILDVIKMVNLMGAYPEVLIFGIEPKDMDFDLDMTQIMKDKIPEMVQVVKRELGLN